MKKTSVILCLSFLCFQLQAQKTAENSLGTWYMYNGSHRLSDKIALKTMAHLRYFEVASEFQQEVYRLGLNYTFNPKTNLTVGLSYATADVAYDTPSNNLYEWRLYEDLNLKSKWGKFIAKHRIRFEHRFIHKNMVYSITHRKMRTSTIINSWLKLTNTSILNELTLNVFKGLVLWICNKL